MMRAIDLIHRWTGGIIGLLLAVLGLSGTVLVFKEYWIGLPGKNDAPQQGIEALARQIEAAGTPGEGWRSIIFANRDFGLTWINRGDGAGAYADQTGQVVASWTSIWGRPELWLFDLHHHLLAGEAGETVAGIVGLIGLGFVVTGAILWWRTRATFAWRLLPKRMSRPAVLMHHRDMGIVFAPLLFLSMATGSLIVMRPVAALVLTPGGGEKALTAPFAMPKVGAGPLAERPDWRAMLRTAKARYPDAEVRIVAVPRKPGDLITVRMRQPAEWLHNGRTLVWFRPENGALVETRDAMTMPMGVRAFNAFYPIHAATVGGLAWKLVMAMTGLALTLLGSLAVWSFWFRRPKARRSDRTVLAPAE